MAQVFCWDRWRLDEFWTLNSVATIEWSTNISGFISGRPMKFAVSWRSVGPWVKHATEENHGLGKPHGSEVRVAAGAGAGAGAGWNFPTEEAQTRTAACDRPS